MLKTNKLAAIALALLLCDWIHGSSTTSNAQKANAFIGSLAVVTHLPFSGSEYNTVSNVTNDLTQIGVHVFRDQLYQGVTNQANFTSVAAAGNQLNVIIVSLGCQSNPQSYLSSGFNTAWDSLVSSVPGGIASIEGSNEINNSPVCYQNSATTNATTASGNPTLHFASTPLAAKAVDAGGVDAGMTLTDSSIATTLDGNNNNGFSSAPAASSAITINYPNELIVVFVQEQGGPTTSVADTCSLTWTKRGSGRSGPVQVEEWYAPGPTGGSYPQTCTVTATQTTTAYIIADVSGWTGVNLSSPFDGTIVTGTSDPLTIWTTHANTVVLGAFQTTTQNPTTSPSFLHLTSFFYQLAEYQVFTNTQTGLSVPIGTGAGTTVASVADALVLTGAPTVPPIPSGTVQSSTAATTVTMNANVVGAGVSNGDSILFQANSGQSNTNPANAAAGIGWQAEIYLATKGDANLSGVPVLNFTDFPNYGGAGTADYNTVHFYATAGQQPLAQAPAQIAAATTIAGKPMQMTETGYYTMPTISGGVDAYTQAVLLLNTMLDNFQNGVVRTFFYELIDEACDAGNTNLFDHFGLFDCTNTAKTVATSLQNQYAIVHDTGGAFSPGTLNYSVSGLSAPSGSNYGGHQMLLEKANGRFYIMLWNEPVIWNDTTHAEIVPSTSSVTVNLGSTATTVNVYDPIISSSAQSTHSSVSSVAISLVADPQIVEVIP